MLRNRALWVGAIAVFVILVASGGTTVAGHGAGVASPGPRVASAPTGAGAAREQRILGELRGSGIPLTDIHLPDLSVAPPHAGETVAPTYASAPAPMGVADLGLTNVSGKIRGSILDSSSVMGQIALTNALSVNVDGDGPNMFGIQLNAVDTGVTVAGNASDQFWTQNFVSYTPSSGQLVFGDNVWNFSNYDAYLSPNVFYATGPNGTLYAPVYYYAIGPTFYIHYPFTLTLYLNSTVRDDRPAVYFNYTVQNSSARVSGSFDYVVFNAAPGRLRHAYPAGLFQINGVSVDPLGLPNDLELDVVGNDDGDTTTFYAIDATASIATWSSPRHAYVAVPSAVDAGSDTGETSDGIAVSYDAGTPVAHLQPGPSFLGGLWGMSPQSGDRKVVQTLNPAATFLFVNPGGANDPETAQWVPGSPTGSTTYYLPPTGAFWAEYLLSDYSPGGAALGGAANSTIHAAFTGTPDRALGVYTPLIAFGNSELSALSTGGAGTLASPYVLANAQSRSLDPQFAAWNDFLWPVFPGVGLYGTTDYVTLTPSSLEITYPSWMRSELSGFGLPDTNHLQIWLWDASHVRLIGGTISGWLSSELFGFPEGDVILWGATSDLVDGVTFLDQGDAISLYGGGGNTVWGNHFSATATNATNASQILNAGNATEGINDSESGDLVYNNVFDVPVPAITPTFDPLSCQIECVAAVYHDAWNVSRQPATDVRTVDGVGLSGSILGYSWQGGNSWSNYGNASNPYGVLPYNDSGLITVGGDFWPLSPPLYAVTFTESGLRAGTSWSVTLAGVTGSSRGASLVLYEPSGSYAFRVATAGGRLPHPASGTVTVRSSGVVVPITFG